jgi:hypothetical protein
VAAMAPGAAAGARALLHTVAVESTEQQQRSVCTGPALALIKRRLCASGKQGCKNFVLLARVLLLIIISLFRGQMIYILRLYRLTLIPRL